VLRSRVRAPGRAFTIQICQMWRELNAHTAGPYQYATNASFRLDGRDLLAPCASLPTLSLDFSRSNARGRSDLHSPKDAWTSQTHKGPGMLPDRRGMSAASSPFRQNGVSSLAATCRSGFREQIDGLGWPRANLCIDTRDPRDDGRVPRAGWPAGPDIPPGARRWDSEANAERAGRRERTALMHGYATVGVSSWHVWSAIWRLTPRPWKRRKLRKG
jgi:hypothetical protein